MDFFSKLAALEAEKILPHKYLEIIKQLVKSYAQALKEHHLDISAHLPLFATFLDLVRKQVTEPYNFEPFHKKITTPFDYYNFGVEFFRPLVDLAHSTLRGSQVARQIEQQLAQGENVVLLANHQTEGDPLILSLLLEKEHPDLAHDIIFVAGERVITDPLAVPFSLGCNLICIYSKKHIDNPPHLKAQKQLHNKRTMMGLVDLLTEGGHCIYVAPSGGRDRLNAQGVVEVARFDANSIELFRLMAEKAPKRTHFYPMALVTYHILPPPSTVEKELGEQRSAMRLGAHVAFGQEVDFSKISSEIQDKQARRQAIADFIWNQVCEDYAALTQKP